MGAYLPVGLVACLEHEVEVGYAIAHGKHLSQHIFGNVVRQVRDHPDALPLAVGAANTR